MKHVSFRRNLAERLAQYARTEASAAQQKLEEGKIKQARAHFDMAVIYQQKAESMTRPMRIGSPAKRSPIYRTWMSKRFQ